MRCASELGTTLSSQPGIVIRLGGGGVRAASVFWHSAVIAAWYCRRVRWRWRQCFMRGSRYVVNAEGTWDTVFIERRHRQSDGYHLKRPSSTRSQLQVRFFGKAVYRRSCQRWTTHTNDIARLKCRMASHRSIEKLFVSVVHRFLVFIRGATHDVEAGV